MISLHVIAEDLSPSHLLAAIKHWVAKFEQEILHTDDGPPKIGVYEFEHDGQATKVHWMPTYPTMRADLTDSDVEAVKAQGPGVSLGLHITPPSAYVPGAPLTGAALARDQLLGQILGEPGPAETAQQTAEQSGSTPADVAVAVAPDLA